MVANAKHAHLHHVRDSLSHVHIPQDKLAANVEQHGIKGIPLQAGVHADANTGNSLSHIKIPDSKKVSFSHVKAPNGQHGSLSHIKGPTGNKGSLSHIKVPEHLQLDNKAVFIENAGKNQGTNVVTVESVVFVTPTTAAPDLAGTPPPQNGHQPNSASGDRGAASYASAKSLANRPHTWTPTHTHPQEHSQTQQIVNTPLSTSRNPEMQQHTSVATTAAAAASSTAAAIGAGAHTSVQSSSPVAAAASYPAATSIGPQVVDSHSPSTGMSGAGKAGVAIGVILGLALIAGLAFFFVRRRKSQDGDDKQEIINEKHGSFFGSNQKAPSDYRGSVQSDTRSTASTAPRLSLRPVTQFLPNIMDGSKGADAQMSEKPKSGWERKQPNPFDDAAVVSEKQTRAATPPANPFDEGDGRKSPSGSSTGSAGGYGTEQSSPNGPGAAAMAGAAAGAPGPRGPNNVHRVQLDFKPSMDDELELKSGQLVRMVHEYDDGWALCTRMDRSQQGVCPRTCLSKLPVKPRPQGPPPNGPNGRPMPPQGGPRGPSPPNSGYMVPRPLTPNGQQRERSQTLNRTSPPSQGSSRSRSQSVADSTNGGGMPPRKPVPGMAM